MPPVQCPDCGRFLKKAFVASLEQSAAPCPGCETMLDPSRLEASTDGDEVRSPGAQLEHELHDPSSVRPPDLAPEEVQDAGAGAVLEGWDVTAGSEELERWRTDRPPFPVDLAVVAGAGALGLLVGGALGRDRRATGAAAGMVLGLIGGAAARRIWRLEP